jgi:hypothetical protein
MSPFLFRSKRIGQHKNTPLINEWGRLNMKKGIKWLDKAYHTFGIIPKIK